MSTKAQVKTQAQTPAAPAAARIPQPPVAAPEHEAERPDIAAQLEGAARLGHSLGAVGVDSSPPPIIQRQEIPEEEEELQMKREPVAIQRQELPEEEDEELQMKPESAVLQWQGPPEEEEDLQTKPANGVQRQGDGEGFQLDDKTAGRINRARGGGQPLEGVLQEQMSASLGHDFSEVRVHIDAEADALNQQLTARAFSTGRDIFFRQGEYNPGTNSGRELIGHELTHVVQQRTGRVGAEPSGMAVRPVGDAFEQEADEMGRQVTREAKNSSRQRVTSKPGGPSPADVEALQKTRGNRAVRRLLARHEDEEARTLRPLAANQETYVQRWPFWEKIGGAYRWKWRSPTPGVHQWTGEWKWARLIPFRVYTRAELAECQLGADLIDFLKDRAAEYERREHEVGAEERLRRTGAEAGVETQEVDAACWRWAISGAGPTGVLPQMVFDYIMAPDRELLSGTEEEVASAEWIRQNRDDLMAIRVHYGEIAPDAEDLDVIISDVVKIVLRANGLTLTEDVNARHKIGCQYDTAGQAGVNFDHWYLSVDGLIVDTEPGRGIRIFEHAGPWGIAGKREVEVGVVGGVSRHQEVLRRMAEGLGFGQVPDIKEE